MQVSPGFFRWWRQPRKIKVGTAQEHHSIGRLCKAQILLFQLLQQEGIDRILHKLTLEDYRNVRSLGRIKGPELTILFADKRILARPNVQFLLSIRWRAILNPEANLLQLVRCHRSNPIGTLKTKRRHGS